MRQVVRVAVVGLLMGVFTVAAQARPSRDEPWFLRSRLVRMISRYVGVVLGDGLSIPKP